MNGGGPYYTGAFMCGVIALVCERSREDLGVLAGELLVSLQYRGYDSAGAAVQGDETDRVTLLKGVGAPSELVPRLGIDRLCGRVLCGQVRWATFGVVDEKNAQPHVVRCRTFLYGAHNGNVTNCDELGEWLRSEGHEVVSDNDGEMVVHTLEHFFHEALAEQSDRDLALRRAATRAVARLEGSFAAVVIDPETHTACAIRRGSSLYFGLGRGESGAFALASSDLSTVLKSTHVLVPIADGEMVLYDAERFQVYGAADGEPRERQPARSRLSVEDAVLRPPYRTFMDQEIHAQPETARAALVMFEGGGEAARAARDALEAFDDDARRTLDTRLGALGDQYEEEALRSGLAELADLPIARALADAAGADTPFASSERAFFADLARIAPARYRLVRGLDAYLEAREVADLARGVDESVQRMARSLAAGGRIYLVSCGTSFHAAKAASLFFADLAGAEVLPLLPGEFRGQYAMTMRDSDLLVSVSQSGETKDLIDVVDRVIASGKEIGRIAVVNNLNSTLAQEKSHVVVPLRCGPEIAVPATKSFLNQLTVFYGLARRLGEALGREREGWPDLPGLMERTLATCEAPIEEAAEHLHLAPSIHILATRLLAVAREGALKIREVVLNHTEGIEGSEFKHGPNTILGFNTLFGPREVQALLERVAEGVEAASDPAEHVRRALHHAIDAMDHDYPLIFITGPRPRDVDLTISQIHTHKIRGALPVLIAEEDPRLRAAISRPPAERPGYRSVYVPLPPTGDSLQTVFSASVALQLLALRMSEKKMAYLESLGLKEHGVHPDVPKNVSKSITVD